MGGMTARPNYGRMGRMIIRMADALGKPQDEMLRAYCASLEAEGLDDVAASLRTHWEGRRRRAAGALALVAYVLTIVAANWALATFGLVPVGFGLMAPAGVLFAGLSFSLRDAVQEGLGRRWTVAAIVVGALLSALVSRQFALASGLAFLASESADLAVYTPLRRRGRTAWAVLLSNTAGDLVDSALFLWLAFGSLDFLAGQLVGKWYATLATLALMAVVRAWRTSRAAAPMGNEVTA